MSAALNTNGWTLFVMTDYDESTSPPSSRTVEVGTFVYEQDAYSAGPRECTRLGGHAFYLEQTKTKNGKEGQYANQY